MDVISDSKGCYEYFFAKTIIEMIHLQIEVS